MPVRHATGRARWKTRLPMLDALFLIFAGYRCSPC
jgi:hypothetical protein